MYPHLSLPLPTVRPNTSFRDSVERIGVPSRSAFSAMRYRGHEIPCFVGGGMMLATIHILHSRCLFLCASYTLHTMALYVLDNASLSVPDEWHEIPDPTGQQRKHARG